MNRLVVIVLLCISMFAVDAATVNQQVHINGGKFQTLDSGGFYYLSFNQDSIFSQRSMVIQVMQNDSLILDIYNHDSLVHHFFIAGKVTQNILPHSFSTVRLLFNQKGIHLFYDDLQFPKNMYLGLSGMITVLEPGRNTKNFFWNLREHQKTWNNNLGININRSTYDPDYFTINGQSYPGIEADSVVKIAGHVGDTLQLFMVNSGFSTHSIHFHGYHGRIISTTSGTLKKDWVKDTFPIEFMESMVIEIVPDKPGIFPVHDHNLIAITGGGRYPNGMLIMMEVK